MGNLVKAFAKQFFGAGYESAGKSLLAAGVLFLAVHAAGLQAVSAPVVLYLTSALFTAGVMWQTLAGRHARDLMQGMLMLPFDSRSFVFAYVGVLGAHALLTKTLLVWALFLAVSSWGAGEIALAVFCGCMACVVTAAGYGMYRKKHAVLPFFWGAGILAVILLARRWAAVLAAAAASFLAAVGYLASADAYDFYHAAAGKKRRRGKAARHAGGTGSVCAYLARYLTENKSYLINTAGLWAAACFLPLLFGAFPGGELFPVGLAVLSMNTPLCTLLSGDPDLEQALRTLPGQVRRFCLGYGLFLFAANGLEAGIYLCSWQIAGGGIRFLHVGAALLFSMQSAALSVFLEWRHPIRGWKTESDLWHHPRKYVVPLAMLLWIFLL